MLFLRNHFYNNFLTKMFQMFKKSTHIIIITIVFFYQKTKAKYYKFKVFVNKTQHASPSRLYWNKYYF